MEETSKNLFPIIFGFYEKSQRVNDRNGHTSYRGVSLEETELANP
jgi:hypothetical protein